MLTPAEQLFEDVFLRLLKGMNTINAFREAALEGLPLAAPALFANYLDVAKSLAAPEHPGEPPLIPADPAVIELMARETAGGVLRSAESAVHAAIVVFAHSVLDATAYGFCKVTRLVDPEGWASVADKRQVSLALVRAQSYETVRDLLLDKHFEQLERESLLKKVDQLHTRCQPPPGWSPMISYAFDRTVLVRLDTLRHDIAHGDALLKGVPSLSAGELFYLARTGWYFMGLVNKRYSLRFRPDFLMRLAETPKGAP